MFILLLNSFRKTDVNIGLYILEVDEMNTLNRKRKSKNTPVQIFRQLQMKLYQKIYRSKLLLFRNYAEEVA